jgi:hypothetical protein
MSDSEFSTLDGQRAFSTHNTIAEPTTDAPDNLLTFLAVAQRLNIPILPATWQTDKTSLGSGGTSVVKQASLRDGASFAFKCVSDRQKLIEREDRIFQILTNEILFFQELGYKGSGISVGRLEGICWDISPGKTNECRGEKTEPRLPEDKVWPALVFEATPYGDLNDFLAKPTGRSLSPNARWELCRRIARTVIQIQDKSKCLVL